MFWNFSLKDKQLVRKYQNISTVTVSTLALLFQSEKLVKTFNPKTCMKHIKKNFTLCCDMAVAKNVKENTFTNLGVYKNFSLCEIAQKIS